MQISIEQIEPDARKSFQAYQYDFPRGEQLFHSHPEIELAVVTGTGGILFCGTETRVFQSGDLFLFGGRLPHRFIGHPADAADGAALTGIGIRRSRALVVQFRPEAFGEAFFKLPENTSIRGILSLARRGMMLGSKHPASEAIVSRMDDIVSAGLNRRLPELLLLLTELAELDAAGWLEFLSPGTTDFQTRDGDTRRMSRLQDLIENGHSRGVTLDMAAETLALTRTSFCRYVKKTTGRTFSELVNDYRLTMAAMRLRDESVPISSVSADVGFGSLSHFNSLFRERFGMTPSEYRNVEHP
jgi:AraC-like DNA-binding protein